MAEFEIPVDAVIKRFDGYVDLIRLCTAGGREYSAWRWNNGVELLLSTISIMTGVAVENLIVEDGTTTWGHPQVAVSIAYWVSSYFAFIVVPQFI